MDTSQAPLMADNRPADEPDHEPELDVALDRASKGADASPGVFIVALTIAAGISGLLFGCEPSARMQVEICADSVD
jgi:SP family myo-inositol transporter-like MFS transporter 13